MSRPDMAAFERFLSDRGVWLTPQQHDLATALIEAELPHESTLWQHATGVTFLLGLLEDFWKKRSA